ncbi:von Willebrand factor type A domain-containing protein [Devosia sp. YIM 151766]|uniref:YfbK domain-containing protein n=1 Tax=Devosia sp. YIM 151766 TaxID=3017325 RepID=UPI00255C9C83|nr:von Willebrand factor type A domain-containing protein [Devosia sp. YIM 151766]WIY52254.1 von Willebrand factor type A domain-containing protein [Devosia sp. YIM 151766]
MSRRNDPFEKLNSAPPPAPGSAARARALAAARLAFEAGRAEAARTAAAPAKGISPGQRLISIINSWRRISIMDMRIPIGTAAIALLVLPLGWQLYSSTALPPQWEHPSPAPPPVADQAAPAPVDVAPAPAMAESAVDGARPAAPAGGVTTTMRTIASDRSLPSLSYAPSGDSFAGFDEQRLKLAAEEPVSTFSLDVDTASYAYVRRMLEDGYVPDPDAVRVEELINYFPYDYPAAPSAALPFQPDVKVFPTPWNARTQILQIGIKGFEPVLADTRSNLVFLIDTSGSMDAPDRLPLLKRAFGLLLDQLSANDNVSIVTYAGSAGIALPPTSADNKAVILAALDQLAAGGGTAGAEGIELAYRLAEEAMIAGGTNRVILATDGDFNVGISDPEKLTQFIAGKRQSGIGLSVLGFGRGNLDDAAMQALAQNGNGNASYISNFAEAKKVLVEEIGGTLHTIAEDVKVQVEFNPARIAEYRLIGYESRALNREDFNNDAVDAGEVGAGTTVTALYEITPHGAGSVDPLRYGPDDDAAAAADSAEIAFLKMRYKLPGNAVSQLIEVPVTADLAYGDIADAGMDAQFAAAVAAFGQKLRGSLYGAAMEWDEIAALARAGRGADDGGYRAEFIRLVNLAAMLKPDRVTQSCEAGETCAP